MVCQTHTSAVLPSAGPSQLSSSTGLEANPVPLAAKARICPFPFPGYRSSTSLQPYRVSTTPHGLATSRRPGTFAHFTAGARLRQVESRDLVRASCQSLVIVSSAFLHKSPSPSFLPGTTPPTDSFQQQ